MVAFLVSAGGNNCGNCAGDAPYPATGFVSSSRPPEYQIGTSESFLLPGTGHALASATRRGDLTSSPIDRRNRTACGLRTNVSARSDGIFPARVISSAASSVSSLPSASANSLETFLSTVSLGGSTRPFSILLR